MNRLAAVALALLIGSTGVVVTTSDAQACDVLPEVYFRIIEDDTPECIELQNTAASQESFEMTVTSSCDETFELEAVECNDCQTEVTVEAPADDEESTEETFVLEAELVEGETYEQYYEWQLGDTDGILTTETAYNGPPPENPCPEMNNGDSGFLGLGCSSTGDAPPFGLLAVVAVGIGTIILRRETAPLPN